ncbi:MAG: transporter substrate-binding domain-containing protein [Marinobacter sp.]|nr:transporter substrate-binding domain-containing protein [Marinobacter sp.]
MTNHPLAAVVFGILLWVVSPAIPAQEREPPLVFGFAAFPPFGYVDDQGNIRGALVDIAKQISQYLGLTVEYRERPPARLFREVADGDIQVTMAAKDHQTLQTIALQSKAPVISSEIRVYRRHDTPAITSVNALQGQHLILITNYAYGALTSYIRDPAHNIQVEQATTHKAALGMLKLGRADYLLNYREPMEALLAEESTNNITCDLIAPIDIHFYVSRAYTNAESLLASLERGLLQQREDDQNGRLRGSLSPCNTHTATKQQN